MKPSKKILLVIVGPTAVGKTALCVDLAKHLQTDIISADSRQFYRELAIGTAKPSITEQGGVKHHFIDSHSVGEYFTPGDFERESTKLLNTLFKKQDIVIATGGSGLYIKALIEGLDEMPEADLVLRESLNNRLQQEGLWALFSELKTLDPDYAAKVDSKNPQRVVRALEVCLSTGKPYSEFRLATKPERPFQVIKICLERPREELYARIDQRMDQMLAEGLMEEAKAFEDKQHLYALKTLGYKEIYGFLRGEYNEEEMIRLLKRNNRHYAKKQMTWFRNQDEFTYLHPSNAFVEILKRLEA
ncbi:tRNA (adenosine(37)-N6)-dimethylallyltransferase MiaA [Aquirufa sp. A-Brett2-15D]